jgi:hypothetical protein
MQSDDQLVDTDIFVVIENENDCYSFVTIDEDASFDAIVIDMSHDEFANAIIVDFDTDTQTDSFVTIDEDQVFVSDFTDDDLLFDY